MSEKRGNLYIISAPSGAGKTSLVKNLLEMVPTLYVSISHTTRTRRPHETEGIHYHYVDRTEFDSLVEAGQFLEYAEVFGHYYGTSKSWVEDQLSMGRDIILEIDWQGARQVKKQLPDTVTIFILPPSYEALKTRLLGRGDDEKVISGRMAGARKEISHYHEYDYIVINDEFRQALDELKTIIRAEKHGYRQQKAYYDDFIAGLLNDVAEKR